MLDSRKYGISAYLNLVVLFRCINKLLIFHSILSPTFLFSANGKFGFGATKVCSVNFSYSSPDIVMIGYNEWIFVFVDVIKTGLHCTINPR